MGLLNMRVVDTTPGVGADCPFTPPAGWEGDDVAYRRLMRQRYKLDIEAGQRMAAYAYHAKRGVDITYNGPFAETAKVIINSLAI